MAEVGRNHPCPCGSGKKYKVCHLRIEEESPAAKAQALGAIERRYMPFLKSFAANFRPECIEQSAELFWLHHETPEIPLQLMAPYGLYHRHDANETSAAEAFLDEHRKKLMPNERALLEAQSHAWLSVWEILDVERGIGIKVRDRLTGEERFCYEQKGSEALVRRDVVLGRVVDCDGVSCFFGMYGRRMSPALADEVEQVLRRKLRKKGKVPPAALRDPKIARLLIEEWQHAFEAFDARPLPTLVNTDGEDLLRTIDHFTLPRGDRPSVLERLAGIDGMEREDEDEDDTDDIVRLVLLRPGNAKHQSWENTIIGQVAVEAAALRVETNSIARADELRWRIERELGGLVRFRTREHSDPIALMGKTPKALGPSREHTAEEQAVLREVLAKHYEAWVDVALPALDGKTPRQTTATAAGRRVVDRLLAEMENHDARRPAGERYDLNEIRRALGLDTV